ncbi:hypothetical protein FQA39_LY00227 [Lamprigera yunnana]|nr:hypothetical protein FQA39_LY00227 [Lamprigera yunnana]
MINFSVIVANKIYYIDVTTEGIFRRTGSLNRQHQLKNLLNQGAPVTLDNNYSVHDCASVLKGFLADLPIPLLTENNYAAYCQLADLCGVGEKPIQESKVLHALQLLILLLPPENRIFLKDVLTLLNFTASYEKSNKMSADNLAIIFTPHFLFPRNLSPEDLHTNSKNLSRLVSIMITKASELFTIPPTLAIDIKAYYSNIEQKISLNLDESAAKTIYTFTDIKKTTKENESNPTESALAELYAHIQSLPESKRKRQLIKRMKKECNLGTTSQTSGSATPKKSKTVTIRDSIKKRIFQKNITKIITKNRTTHIRSTIEDLLGDAMKTLHISRAVHNVPKMAIKDSTAEGTQGEFQIENVAPSGETENLNTTDYSTQTFQEKA